MLRLREISRLRIPYPPPLQVYIDYIMCGYLTEFYEEVVLQWCCMAIGAHHFHSHEQPSGTHHVFALIGRIFLATDTQVERISSSTELLAISGLVLLL